MSGYARKRRPCSLLIFVTQKVVNDIIANGLRLQDTLAEHKKDPKLKVLLPVVENQAGATQHVQPHDDDHSTDKAEVPRARNGVCWCLAREGTD
jgi:hypothetical protein